MHSLWRAVQLKHFYVYRRLAYMCVCVSHSGDQKSISDTLELELQRVVRCLVGARNQTQALCKISHCSYPLSHLCETPAWSMSASQWGLGGSAKLRVVAREPGERIY